MPSYQEICPQLIELLGPFVTDGQEITGWQIERIALRPELWDNERYVPNPEADLDDQGVYFYPRATRADEPPAVVAGIEYLGPDGAVVAYEPLITPMIITRQSQSLHIAPALRLFGSFRSEL